MNVINRLFSVFIVLMSVLGVGICVLAAVLVWRTGDRLSQINHRVFDRIDVALVAGRARVLDVQKRVQDSKITTEDVRQGVENWARREAKQRLASRPELENSVERLALGLQQADVWLELSGTSLQGVQQAFELASSFGVSADASIVDPLIERLGALRGRLKDSTETVEAIRARIADAADGEALEERLARFAQLALRVVATLSDIDARLGQLAERFVTAQANGQQLKIRTDGYILAVQIGAALLALWMAIGQIFLGRYGWTQFSKRPSPA